MTKQFKRGDVVVVSEDLKEWAHGLTGTIRTPRNDYSDTLVEFSEDDVRARGNNGHEGDGRDGKKTRWYIQDRYLTLKSEFEDGRKEIEKIKATEIDWFALNKEFAS